MNSHDEIQSKVANSFSKKLGDHAKRLRPRASIQVHSDRIRGPRFMETHFGGLPRGSDPDPGPGEGSLQLTPHGFGSLTRVNLYRKKTLQLFSLQKLSVWTRTFVLIIRS